MVATISFFSFGRVEHGRVIPASRGLAVVQSRNPYGRHNLVLVDEGRGEAIRHGTSAVVEAAANWLPRRQYRRVR